MKLFLTLLLIYAACPRLEAATCKIIVTKRVPSVQFVCSELNTLNSLDKARKNSTVIEISHSKIPTVPGHTFARFGATLRTLDMHECGIETIESEAFVALTNLEKLILWGNKLRWAPSSWFSNTYNLRTLDLSFNVIQDIEYIVYQILPNLENLYLDYNQLKFIDFNMIGYLRNLKKIKFGKNPLNWAYRARLTWQLENQHVEYSDDWEDWAWMNVGIRGCIEKGQGELPSDTILDCLVGNLLDFTYDSLTDDMRQQPIGCFEEARRLVRCMRPLNATTNTDNETIRKILQDYLTILPVMSKAQSLFSVPNTR